MKPGLVKTTYRRAIRRAARTALVGRLRDRERHEEGRFTRAEVDELLKQTWIAYDQLASDLCIETWCNLDFPLAEMWGGRLERTQTLAAGCEHCDFRFKAVRPE
jgi:hypothetical protein